MRQDENMPILLKTQVESADKTPVTVCRARVGGLCRFCRPAEPCTHPAAENQTLRRRAGALRKWQTQKKDVCERISAEGEAANGEAGQSRGVVRIPRRSHLPAVRAVWSFKRGVTERGKIAPVGSQFEKSPPFQGKRRGCTKKVHGKRKKQQVQRWVKNSELAGKGSLQAQKLASCLLKNPCFTAPEIQPESAGRSSAEII